MGDVLRSALGLFAAIAPLGGLIATGEMTGSMRAEPRLTLIGAAACLAFALLGVSAVLGEPFSDLLDVAPESFPLAAGVAMLPVAARLLWRGESVTLEDTANVPDWRLVLVPLTVPVLAGPAAIAGALSYGTRFGLAETIAGAGIALVVSVALLAVAPVASKRMRREELRALGRLSGLLLVAIAVELIVDGVQTV